MLGLSRADFYEMRVGEFWEAMKAFREEKDSDRIHAGELARGAAIRLFNIQLKRSCRIKDPHEFWPMPWDDNTREEKEREIIEKLQNLAQDERDAQASSLLDRIGWR